MNVAVYARYSSDQQREASIADQLHICRLFAARQGWHVAYEFSDAAQSGATLLRTGMQQVLQTAQRGLVQLVLAESLDRLSRDQEDIAFVFKRLTFANVHLHTVAEGMIGHLHIGLKGTMNALYLKDLADKTRRGLQGRVHAGKSGGGRCYGYALVNGDVGARTPIPAEAQVVKRIFREFVAGRSPKAIAKKLNTEGIPGPSGRPWGPSTINGSAIRGTGLLNNELYVGRLIWNRLQYVKNPDTGKRVSRINPRDAWITTNVPELRIIDDDLWQAAKARQNQTRHCVAVAGYIGRAKRPVYLFSGMTKCAWCGCGFAMFNRSRLACSGARERGICDNRLTIRREDVEARVLTSMQERLWRAEAFEAFCRRLTLRLNELRTDARQQVAHAMHERSKIDSEIARLIQVLKDGFDSVAVRDELLALERRKAVLPVQPVHPPRALPIPDMAALYREKVTGLRDALSRPEDRSEAADLLRALCMRSG